MAAPEHADRRLRFDGTITAGSLLQGTVLVLGLAAGWAHLEGRIVRLEESKQAMGERFDREGSDIRLALRDVNAKLDRLIERFTPQR
jgi:hypothetical protein